MRFVFVTCTGETIMPKRKLTPAEKTAYRELSRAAAKLRRAQEAAERKRLAAKTGRQIEQEQEAAEDGRGVDHDA